MKRFVILLVLPILACRGLSTPLPSTPTPDPALPTFALPTTLSTTSAPTAIPPTEGPPPPSDATSFPDSNNYAWQLIVSNLERPVDLQSDGSGRLFAVEKLGHIHIIENGQLVETPFLNIEDRVNDSSNGMGLLGLPFHPNYKQNGFFFINYTGNGGDTFISRF